MHGFLVISKINGVKELIVLVINTIIIYVYLPSYLFISNKLQIYAKWFSDFNFRCGPRFKSPSQITRQKSMSNRPARYRHARESKLAYIMGFFCNSKLSHREMGIASVHSLYLQNYHHDVGNNIIN